MDISVQGRQIPYSTAKNESQGMEVDIELVLAGVDNRMLEEQACSGKPLCE